MTTPPRSTAPLRVYNPDPNKYPRTRVGGEIKPHTKDGIAAGAKQWRDDRRGVVNLRRHLVTYEPEGHGSNTFHIRISDPDELKDAINRRKPLTLKSTWRYIGDVHYPGPLTIPLTDCPTILGQRIEPYVRQRYAEWLGITLSADKKAQQKGMDFQHELELIDFLRELADELEGYV